MQVAQLQAAVMAAQAAVRARLVAPVKDDCVLLSPRWSANDTARTGKRLRLATLDISPGGPVEAQTNSSEAVPDQLSDVRALELADRDGTARNDISAGAVNGLRAGAAIKFPKFHRKKRNAPESVDEQHSSEFGTEGTSRIRGDPLRVSALKPNSGPTKSPKKGGGEVRLVRVKPHRLRVRDNRSVDDRVAALRANLISKLQLQVARNGSETKVVNHMQRVVAW